jgi:hypothetical protein
MVGTGPGAAVRAGRPAALVLGACIALVIAGCGGAGRPAAGPAPPPVPGETTTGPDLAGVTLPDFTFPLITGGVSRPRPRLTPGAVASTDTSALCSVPDHSQGDAPAPAQAAVFREYGDTTPQLQQKYEIDYLVPLPLGGAQTLANLWPAALKGTGYFEKIQLDHVLRDLVCRRTITLLAAQHDLEQNWYAAWLQYVVAAGRA